MRVNQPVILSDLTCRLPPRKYNRLHGPPPSGLLNASMIHAEELPECRQMVLTCARRTSSTSLAARGSPLFLSPCYDIQPLLHSADALGITDESLRRRGVDSCTLLE